MDAREQGNPVICLRDIAMDETPLYGTARIAEYLGISESTLRRWRKTPEGAFLEVGSMSNVGGGLGRALWTYPSSADHLKNLMQARVSSSRSVMALDQWTRTNSGSTVMQGCDKTF
jgi:hypothetical protein